MNIHAAGGSHDIIVQFGTALHAAAYGGQAHVLQCLLNIGADLHRRASSFVYYGDKGSGGYTVTEIVLHPTARVWSPGIWKSIESLVNAGARMEDSVAALELAVIHGKAAATVDLLLRARKPSRFLSIAVSASTYH